MCVTASVVVVDAGIRESEGKDQEFKPYHYNLKKKKIIDYFFLYTLILEDGKISLLLKVFSGTM